MWLVGARYGLPVRALWLDAEIFCLVRDNHPDPRSGREVDPDKPQCTMSCQEDVTDPKFLCAFFSICVLDHRLLQPRVVKIVIGSVSVEHPNI